MTSVGRIGLGGGRSAEAALNRIPRDASVVYVMNHRSNADYLLVAFLLADRVSISYAVGEWARVWPLEGLFRSFGSFFVRRRFRDPLYHAVLERYVQRDVTQGTTQGIFIEGGLSRDGRLQGPKLGLLDYMLRAGAKDLVFIPVGINYDRVVEDSNLVREALGKARRSPLALLRRTALWLLGLAWRGATGRFHRFGYAVVNFGQPIFARAASVCRSSRSTNPAPATAIRPASGRSHLTAMKQIARRRGRWVA